MALKIEVARSLMALKIEVAALVSALRNQFPMDSALIKASVLLNCEAKASRRTKTEVLFIMLDWISSMSCHSEVQLSTEGPKTHEAARRMSPGIFDDDVAMT